LHHNQFKEKVNEIQKGGAETFPKEELKQYLDAIRTNPLNPKISTKKSQSDSTEVKEEVSQTEGD